MTTVTLMRCGHAANATIHGMECCAICVPSPSAYEPAPLDGEGQARMLDGRVARCSCGEERPSTLDGSLAFFEYQGEGSPSAAMCECGYAPCAHDPDYMEALAHLRSGERRKTVIERGNCTGYRPRGDVGHDRFYCGCRGWD